MEKKTSDQHCSEWSVVSYRLQTIHCNFGLKCFFVIVVMYAYFIDISQASAETHLQCGGTYNNCIIANCLQSVPVKEF